jgi:tRNA G26 N,N-dimethylase Trm1
MAKSKNPRLVRKGTKVTRETVVCEKCGAEFERAIVHPYIKTCKACRGTKVRERKARNRFERIGCKHCHEAIRSGSFKPGRNDCKHCYTAWVLIVDDFYKVEYQGDTLITRGDQILGKVEHHGDIRRLINES